MKLLCFLLLSYSFSSFASKDGFPNIEIKVEDFEVVVVKKTIDNLDIKGRLLKETMRWNRGAYNILFPEIVVDLVVPSFSGLNLTSKYKGVSRNLYTFNQFNRVTFYYSLFESNQIEIFRDNKLIANVYVIYKGKEKKHHIDYSCDRYDVQFIGLNNYPLSAQCYIVTYGDFGKEKNILKIAFTVPHVQLPNGSTPPFLVELERPMTLSQTLFDPLKNEEVPFRISAEFGIRSKRLKTAIGFGPYDFALIDKGESIRRPTVPLMLYANFQLSPDKSFRMFNAMIYNESYFNNAGFYYAYTNSSLDNRLLITPLLGLQSINIKNHLSKRSFSDFIGPQGVEFIWNHAFDIPGYIVGMGLFIAPGSNVDYKNMWIRWGKKYFWELNYLSYRNDEEELFTKSWGVSIGIPFFQLF
ncbi:MAG: hypothetical protein H6621_08065 [Halobacteriovoraceae bacterium]|nr:hypothetical protein [Halobacteriovoraceae bacterium]